MAGMKMTIYVPSKIGLKVALLRSYINESDLTLQGEKGSLEKVVSVEPNAFIEVFLPDDEIDATYREITRKALERGWPVRTVTHYHEDAELKTRVRGKVGSLGESNVYFGEQSQGDIWIFKTGIFKSKKDDCVYVVSYPHFIGNLNRKSLMERYEDFPSPKFAEGINRGNIKYNLGLANKDVLEKLGMESGFCYACPSDVLITKQGTNIQIVMDGVTIKEHRKKEDYKADMPINLSRNLGHNQGASIQINYGVLYELLGEVFPDKVKVASIDGK